MSAGQQKIRDDIKRLITELRNAGVEKVIIPDGTKTVVSIGNIGGEVEMEERGIVVPGKGQRHFQLYREALIRHQVEKDVREVIRLIDEINNLKFNTGYENQHMLVGEAQYLNKLKTQARHMLDGYYFNHNDPRNISTLDWGQMNIMIRSWKEAREQLMIIEKTYAGLLKQSMSSHMSVTPPTVSTAMPQQMELQQLGEAQVGQHNSELLPERKPSSLPVTLDVDSLFIGSPSTVPVTPQSSSEPNILPQPVKSVDPITPSLQQFIWSPSTVPVTPQSSSEPNISQQPVKPLTLTLASKETNWNNKFLEKMTENMGPLGLGKWLSFWPFRSSGAPGAPGRDGTHYKNTRYGEVIVKNSKGVITITIPAEYGASIIVNINTNSPGETMLRFEGNFNIRGKKGETSVNKESLGKFMEIAERIYKGSTSNTFSITGGEDEQRRFIIDSVPFRKVDLHIHESTITPPGSEKTQTPTETPDGSGGHGLTPHYKLKVNKQTGSVDLVSEDGNNVASQRKHTKRPQSPRVPGTPLG